MKFSCELNQVQLLTQPKTCYHDMDVDQKPWKYLLRNGMESSTETDVKEHSCLCCIFFYWWSQSQAGVLKER